MWRQLVFWQQLRKQVARAWAQARLLFPASAVRLGDRGEQQAERFLIGLGYRIISRQYRNRWGEIDLIAEDGPWLVFIEVKTRRTAEAGAPFEAVHRGKQTKLTNLALTYLKQRGWLERRVRFDVVSILWQEGAAPQIQLFRHAFEPHSEGQFFA